MLPGSERSQQSREQNTQQVWSRSTIPWSLTCDRDVFSREDASVIFNQRLDHLGFMDYVVYFSISILVLTLVPFCFYAASSDNEVKTNFA